MTTRPDLAPGFVSELIRAANEIQKLTSRERVRLLERAAWTIREYREQIALTDGKRMLPDEPGEMTYDLSSMARKVDAFNKAEVAAALLRAAGAIKVCRMMLGIKVEVEVEDMQPEGTA